MRKRDFIITSLQPWDMPIGSNAKDIALEISKQNRVLYINTPLDKKSFLKDRNSNSPDYLQRYNVIKGATSTLRQISASLWVRITRSAFGLQIPYLMENCLTGSID